MSKVTKQDKSKQDLIDYFTKNEFYINRASHGRFDLVKFLEGLR